MIYALISEGQVATYPYTLRQMRADHPHTSFSEVPPAHILAEYGVYEVASTAQPTPTIQQNVRELTPTFVDGVWKQGWELVDAPAEEVAERQKEAADEVDRLAVIADSFVPTFLAMTPAQLNTYIDNNTATLATTRALLKKMAIMLLILGRNGGLRA